MAPQYIENNNSQWVIISKNSIFYNLTHHAIASCGLGQVLIDSLFILDNNDTVELYLETSIIGSNNTSLLNKKYIKIQSSKNRFQLNQIPKSKETYK